MKTLKTFGQVLLVAAAWLSCSAVAQVTPDYRETFITGEITYAYHPNLEGYSGFLETPLTFHLKVTEDFSAPTPFHDPSSGYFNYANVTKKFEFWLYDVEANEVLYEVVDFTADNAPAINDDIASYNQQHSETGIASAMWGVISSSYPRIEFAIGENRFTPFAYETWTVTTPLVASVSPVPELLSGVLAHPFGAIKYDTWRFEGTALRVSYDGFYSDDDGDNVADADDVCPASLLDETVVFDGWYDSGVVNHVDATGCSIMDRYAMCEAEQQSGSSITFYSGPSYCEMQVAYQLYADGIIDYTEVRMLRIGLTAAHRE